MTTRHGDGDGRAALARALFDRPSHNPAFDAVRDAVAFDGPLADFCVPVNTRFPPPALKARIRDHLDELLRHYPGDAAAHEARLAALVGLPADNLVVANGSTELITLLCRDCEGPLVTPVPTFGRWTDLPLERGLATHFVTHARDRGFALDVDEIVAAVRTSGARTLVLCNPNNPTGAAWPAGAIARLIRTLADLPLIVVDESFIDFSGLESCAPTALASANTVVVKSLGKSLGWHGVRLGYAVANAATAARLRRQLPFWHVNGLAAFVLKQMADFRDDYVASFALAMRDREHMAARLREATALTVFPSHANFLYAELPAGVSGRAVRDALLHRHGVLVRECGNKLGAGERYLRLAVNDAAAVERLVRGLDDVLPRDVLPRVDR